MKFERKKPCSNCPFRKDKPFPLSVARAREITDGLIKQQATFTCHKTLDLAEREQQHCAGALIMLEKMGQPNQMMRISERLGMYNRFELDMDFPVYKNHTEFINAMKKINKEG